MYNYGSEARAMKYSNSADGLVEVKGNRLAVRGAQMDAFKKTALKTLAILTAILAVMLIREAQIDQLCGQKDNINKEIGSLEALIMEKEMHLSYQLDMNNVDQVAVSVLGMKKPDASQYVYINVEKDNGGEILVTENATGNSFSAFINNAKILLEYLY